MDARSLFDALERRFGDAVHDFTTDGTKDTTPGKAPNP